MNEDPTWTPNRLEWVCESSPRLHWRGFLRGYPDTTLFILNVCEDHERRCDMVGAVIPDDRDNTRVLISWAFIAAEFYLEDFLERVSSGIGEA